MCLGQKQVKLQEQPLASKVDALPLHHRVKCK